MASYWSGSGRRRRVVVGVTFPRSFGAMRTDPPDEDRDKNEAEDHERRAASDGLFDVP